MLRNIRLTGALCFLVDASAPWDVEVTAAETFRAMLLPRAEHLVSYHIILGGADGCGSKERRRCGSRPATS